MTRGPLRILLLEDVDTDAELAARELQGLDPPPDIIRVETGGAFLAALSGSSPDVILADYSLPRFSGPEALHLARTHAPEVPFIFVSGAIGEEVAIEMLKGGATDYVLKHRLGRLRPAVERALREVRERRERERMQGELRESHEQLRALAGRLESVREEERTRIARELHDELGQVLTALRIDLSWIDTRFGKDNEQLLAKTRAMVALIEETIGTVRRIAADLRPGILDDLGLSAALEWQAMEFTSRTGIRCGVTVPPDLPPVAPDPAIALFRIFQEALTNIMRHAGATTVEVAVGVEAGCIRMTVRDNGRGITEADLRPGRSLGLVGMRERARALGGQVTIEGKHGGGTVVIAVVPTGAGDPPVNTP
jgi:signal transduction histidine kinase